MFLVGLLVDLAKELRAYSYSTFVKIDVFLLLFYFCRSIKTHARNYSQILALVLAVIEAMIVSEHFF